ncbi:MAG: hypothetical protein HZA51_11460 [Planctomycetes bacterium]|nr:hypothetical protein [Planctomycetota bacterium]
MNQQEFVKWFGITSVVGTVLQVGMVLAGHYNEFVKQNVFAAGGMLISLIVGAWFGGVAARSKAGAMAGGALVGGDCALVGIAVSVVLKDSEPMILAFGTMGSAVAGLIGGVVMYALAGSKRSPQAA